MELTINTVLHNKYRIISILGSGGFGITYLAEHELLGQKVAIKEFFMDGCIRADAGDISYRSTKTDLFVDFKARFKTEAQTLAKFKHPSIVRVTDIFEENGTSYFVMDCIEGQTLKEWVQQHGAMPVKTAVNYLKQIIGALEEVHAKDMLHRDIKPDNIMISNNGTAVLIDFGAARNFISEHTQTNTGIYTPGYAPKEQYASGKLDARTDIYGLCATFYYTLTAQKPIDAISRFPDDSLASLSQIDSDIPEWLSELIMKGLSPDMKNRFSSVAEMETAMSEEKTTLVKADKTSIAKQEAFVTTGKVLEIKVPTIAESIIEVTVSRWYKKDGDVVKLGDLLCEFETDKATLELEAEASGKLTIIAKEGDNLAIGAPICKIEVMEGVSMKSATIDEGKTIINQSNKTEFVNNAEKTQINTIDKTTIHQLEKTAFIKEEKTDFNDIDLKARWSNVEQTPKSETVQKEAISISKPTFTDKPVDAEKSKSFYKIALAVLAVIGIIVWFNSNKSNVENRIVDEVASDSVAVVEMPVDEVASPNSSSNKKIQYNDKIEEHNVSDIDSKYQTIKIGTIYQGGIIAYIYQPGDPGYVAGETHGLIVAASNQGIYRWYNDRFQLKHDTDKELGTGASNTAKIVAELGASSYAAKICDDLVLGGYSDWFLPSLDELYKIYLNKEEIGGFVEDYCWSSSGSNDNIIWYQLFSNKNTIPEQHGNQGCLGGGAKFFVRAVRDF